MCANKKGIIPFLVGIGAGLATGFWLNSEEGKGWRRETADRAKTRAADLKERAGEAADKVNEYVAEAVNKIKHAASEAANDLKCSYPDASDQPSTSEAVRDGIEKAHERLDDVETSTD